MQWHKNIVPVHNLLKIKSAVLIGTTLTYKNSYIIHYNPNPNALGENSKNLFFIIRRFDDIDSAVIISKVFLAVQNSKRSQIGECASDDGS